MLLWIKHSLYGTSWAHRIWWTMNIWTRISKHIVIHFKSLVCPKYTVTVHRARTDWHNIIFFVSALQQSSILLTGRPVSQALQTQTITILERQIPSLEWSYWFPSEYVQSKSLYRHQSNSGLHNFTASRTSVSKLASLLLMIVFQQHSHL